MPDTSVPDEPPTDGAEPGADDGSGRSRPRVAPFVVAIVAIVAAGLVWVMAGADANPNNETAETPLLNQVAPDATGELSDGTPFDLSRRKGSWVVLNFFQSSCVPCIQEHPDLVQFVESQGELGTRGAEFYTIVYDDDRASVEAFFNEHGGGDWPVVYDDRGSIAVAFGVSKVPETWIIDPQGVVRERIISRTTAEYLTTRLDQLRGEV